MKILHTLASPAFSGPAEGLLALAKAQRALGHQVTIAVDRLRQQVDSEELAAPVLEAAGILDDGGLELSVKSTPVGMVRDMWRLKRRSVDVVHAHFSHDHVLARFGRPKGAVLIRSIHAPRSLSGLPSADGYTVPSEKELAALGRGPCVVLPVAIDDRFVPPPDRAALRQRLGLDGAPLVGMVSTFQPSRRHDVALEAFASLLRQRPEARLLLMGDGALEATLRAQAARLGAERHVTFAGYLRGREFLERLQALDQLWVLGLGNDFGGRAALQGRACGVRVIAVDEGALPQWADEVVPPTPLAIEQAALRDTRLSKHVPSATEIAKDLQGFYEHVIGARRS